jgi:eukaryotic-like serine/threonine-protein kinase
MTAERWAQIDRVWQAVLARPEHERSRALAELCGADHSLRREVDSLLLHRARASAAGFGAVPLGEPSGRVSLLGRQFGPYSVQALIGAGGMGEVYQALDASLGRNVALKILSDAWVDEPDRRARFDREARVLASLNHPNIGSIYGIHEGDGIRALVLELVDGETLADRLQHTGTGGGLPITEAVTIAGQIIDALEVAHVQGIVHRDLKPANIKLTPDGRVKVLDFGLARATTTEDRLGRERAADGAVTRDGVLLGTAPYMSPEQARGDAVDKRADIWAFGCVLYELLTGTRAFADDGRTDVLAKVLTREPDWTLVPRGTPSRLRICLQRCLEKDVRRRFHDIGDVRLALQGAFEQAGEASRSTPDLRPPSLKLRRTRVAYAGWGVAALATVAAVAITALVRHQPPELPETRLQILTPPTDHPASLALAPDGRSLVFQGRQGDHSILWLRRFDSEDAKALPGTEDGAMPFWSPDNESVAFFAGGVLKRIDLASGFVRRLASAPQPRRGAWNRDGIIVYGAGSVGPLFSVPADGGGVQQVTSLLPGQTHHRWPQFLPDQRRFLLFALGTAEVRGLYVGSLDDRAITRLSDRESAYGFLPPAHVLLARQGALWAGALNGAHTALVGPLIPVAPKVLVSGFATGYGAFSASESGSIAYRPSPGEKQLSWLDRSGRPVRDIGTVDDNQLVLDDLSPDGYTAVVERTIDGTPDLWIVDTERGVSRRLTSDPGFDSCSVFSSDGSRIMYVTDGEADVFQIHSRRTDGTGSVDAVFRSPENKNPSDWSRDGRYLVFESQSPQTSFDLLAIPLSGDRKPFDVARTPAIEWGGKISPDGRWVAYVSNESRRSEIYVQSFPTPGPRLQISVGGGGEPRWRADGRELYYLAPDNRLMAVAIAAAGSTLEPSPPQILFSLSSPQAYEPSPDGQRFLVARTISEASPISVILNWKPPVR